MNMKLISNLSTTWQLAISTVASTSVSSTGRLRTLCVLKQMVTNVKNVTTKYWKDRTNSEIDIFATSAKGQENNLVKIAVLGGARREATIGSSEELKGTGIYTYNDRIG